MPHSATLTPTARQDRRKIGPSGGALFLGVVATPPALFYFGFATSFAAGMVLVALWLLVIAPSAAGMLRSGLRPIGWNQVQRVSAFVFVAVLAHFSVAAVLGPVSLSRGLASLLPLLLLLLAAPALANALLAVPEQRFHRSMLQVFCWMCLMALVGTLGWGPPTLLDAWRRPVFPFSEPSAFALAFIPALMYVCAATHGTTRLALVIAGLACSVLIQNLTLVFGVLLVVLVTLRMHMLALLSVPVVFVVLQLDLSYFAERLDFSGEANNLSNLVFLQGWQMIEEALDKSGGLGLGFQQLGVNGTEVFAAQVIRSLLDGEDMNLLDGGFVFAKLGSDFGVAGFALAAGHLLLALRSGAWLRQVASRRRQAAPALILAHSSVLTFLVEMFVRSAGYFSGTALLFAASLWLTLRPAQPGH